LQRGAQVRGIRNPHSKLYLFRASQAIVTSANLTAAGLTRNFEFGFVSENAAVVGDCRAYFDDLWKQGADLAPGWLDDWDAKVTSAQAFGMTYPPAGLGDYGADVGFTPPPSLLPIPVADAGQGFVKFFGESTNREPLTTSSEAMI